MEQLLWGSILAAKGFQLPFSRIHTHTHGGTHTTTHTFVEEGVFQLDEARRGRDVVDADREAALGWGRHGTARGGACEQGG